MPTRTARLALLLPLAGFAAGCGLFHHAPPQPPPILILQPPLIFPAPPMPPMAPPYVLAPALAPPPALAALLALRAPYGPPPRRDFRRGPAPAPKPAAPAPASVNPPLTAGLNPQQQAYYRGQAVATLRQAGAVLQRLDARRLSPSAAATRAQANEYVRQARQALALGDVVRAQTLADKAYTLARFLAGE